MVPIQTGFGSLFEPIEISVRPSANIVPE
jgi:hypothetical protein